MAKVAIGSLLPLTATGGIGAHDEAGVEGLLHLLGDEDVDLVDAGERLDARGDVDGIADHGELHEPVAPHHARDHVAGVDPDAELQLGEPAGRELLVVGGERGAHRERGLDRVGGLPRVVLERAEQRHQAVAHQPRQVSVMRDQRAVHGAEVAVQHLDHRGGRDPLGHRREPLEVGEHDGDPAVRRLGRARPLRELLDDVERREALERLLDVLETFDRPRERGPVPPHLRAQPPRVERQRGERR